MKSLFLFAICMLSQITLAWGGRGHDVICESATQLVEDPELKSFLVTRTHIMGHLCNVPDISWKRRSSNYFEKIRLFLAFSFQVFCFAA